MGELTHYPPFIGYLQLLLNTNVMVLRVVPHLSLIVVLYGDWQQIKLLCLSFCRNQYSKG